MTEIILALALFERQTTTRLYGLDGPTVSTARTANSARLTVRNLNGREVPVETMEQRVVSEAPGLRIVERIIRRYDANGRAGPPEKLRIETRTVPDGATEVSTTTWRGDINGNLRLSERSVALTRRSGVEYSDTTVNIERPSADGRLELFERKQETRRATGPGRSTESSISERRDVNGRWIEVLRITSEQERDGGNIDETRTEYEPATTGRMRLIRQTVSRVSRLPDGASVTKTDVFEPALPGRAAAPDEPLQRTRQLILERSPTSDGAVEGLSVRFADPSSPQRLGPARKVEETTCKGDCEPAMMK